MAEAQLSHWRGGFGDAYIDRNPVTGDNLRARTMMWARILRSLVGDPPESILEVGANIGQNLYALSSLATADLYGLEPNAKARQRLADEAIVPAERALDGTASAIPLADRSVDLAFTSGVLIHIAPSELLASCREIHRVSRKYVLSIEYYSKHPEEIVYREHKELLFKRDFGKFWLENFDDLTVLDYGFFWEPVTGIDDLTWWLFGIGRE